MFEKKSEEYADEKCGKENRKTTSWVLTQDDFQKGAEFGYNKANEWHYPSKGEYPKHEKDVQVLYQDCDKINTYNCVYDIQAKNWLYYNLDDMVLELFTFNVIAWKEIVLPELPKENE